MQSKQEGGKQDSQQKAGADLAHERETQQRAQHSELEQEEEAESSVQSAWANRSSVWIQTGPLKLSNQKQKEKKATDFLEHPGPWDCKKDKM